MQVYAAPILFERNAYDVPVFTRVHDFMWSGISLFQIMCSFAILKRNPSTAKNNQTTTCQIQARLSGPSTVLCCATQPWQCRTWQAPCSWASRFPTTPCLCRCWSTSSSGTPTRTLLARTSTCLSRLTLRRRARWVTQLYIQPRYDGEPHLEYRQNGGILMLENHI